MAYKIAHISDVHWESRDNGVCAELTQALRRENPNLIVFTGDLVDNPQRIKKAKPWLLDLCASCGLNPENDLLVVPGNHDYRFWGNIGFLPLTSIYFWKYFKLWKRFIKIVRIADSFDLTFLHIDSNPVLWGAARGKVGWWEMRRLRKALQALSPEDQLRVRSSLKIALVHHHPLPIPFGGNDTFLFLKDAQRMLQFLAENKVDMVLHGHKHHAPYSLLALGTSVTGAGDRVLEVLGAGAAVKTNDYDPRGHNFNMICIEPDGLRYVQQFFAPPQRQFIEQAPCGYPSQSFSLAYEHSWKAHGLRFRSIHWDMRIDPEGDRFNEIAYTGFAVREGTNFTSLSPPPYTVDTGHLSGVWPNPEKTDADIYIKETVTEPRYIKFEVFFSNRPTESDPARFAIQSWDLNACCLNLAEFRKKFPTRQPQREWEEKHIRAAVDDFYWAIRFPRELAFQNPPEFEVWKPDGTERHEWLTQVLQPNFYYSPELRTATLSLHKPPGDFLYRIYWYPAEAAANAPIMPELKLQVQDLVHGLLAFAGQRKHSEPLPEQLVAINRALGTIAQLVVERIEAVSKTTGKVLVEDMDVSLMVYDDTQSLVCPVLRIAALIGNNSEKLLDFSLEEGDGNAGRAYKKRVFRCYDSKIPDPKRHTYVLLKNYPKHEVLYSIPLVHPEDNNLIFGILNIGSFDRFQADWLRQLETEEGTSWLLHIAHSYLLPKLLETFNISQLGKGAHGSN